MTATSAAWPCSWLQRPQQLRSHCRPLHLPAPGAQVRHAPLLFMLRRFLYASVQKIHLSVQQRKAAGGCLQVLLFRGA